VNETLKARLLRLSAIIEALCSHEREEPLGKALWQEAAGELSAALDELEQALRGTEQQKARPQAAEPSRGAASSTEPSDALEAQRDLLETIMENTPAHLAYLDPEFRFLRVNSAYLKGCGRSRAELLGRSHFELFPHEENKDIFRRVRDTGEPVRFAARPFVYPDQPERGVTYWDWSLVPVKDATGGVRGLVLSLMDVTDAEQARRAREEHLRSLTLLMEATQALLAESSVRGMLSQVAMAARSLTGAQVALAISTRPHGRHVICVSSGERSDVVALDRLRPKAARCLERMTERPSFRLGGDGWPLDALCDDLGVRHASFCALAGARLTDRGGRPAGAIALSRRESGEFSAEDEALLRQLASLASLGLWHLEATREAERRAEELATVFGAMNNVVFVYDAQGAIIRSNPAAEALLGGTPVGEDRVAISQRIRLRHIDGTPVRAEELPSSRALAGETVAGERYTFVDASGADVTVLISSAPIRQGNAVSGAVVVWHDVTERERLFNALELERSRLRASEARARALLNAPSDSEALLAPDGSILAVNVVGAADVGHSPEDLVGKAIYDFLHPDHAEALRAQVEETVRLGDTVRREYRQAGRVVDQTCIPVHDGAGAVSAVAVYGRDVTEARQAAEALFRREQEFRALVENSPDIIVRVDRDLRLAYANPALGRLLGMEVDEIASADCESLGLDAAAVVGLEERLNEAFGTGLEQTLEFDIDTGEERRSFEARLVPELTPDGSVGSVLAVARDITERERSRASLRRLAARLQVLHAIDKAILVAESTEEIASAALRNLRRLIPYRRASVVLFTEDGQAVVCSEFDPVPDRAEPRDWCTAPDRIWFLDLLQANKTYHVADLTQVAGDRVGDDYLAGDNACLRYLREQGVRDYVAVPLTVAGRVIGALTVGMGTPCSLEEHMLDVVYGVADQVAIGIRQAQLQQQVMRHTESLEQTVARRTAALRQSEERFRAIFEEAAIGVALVDDRGRIRDANRAFQEMFGCSMAELYRKPLSELEDDGQDPLGEDLQRVLDGELEKLKGERRYRRKSGAIMWVEQVISAVRRAGRGRPFAIAMLDDVTERKQVMAAMVQNEKLTVSGRLAASLAHEINNPLQSVIGCLGLTRELLAPDDSDAIRYVDVGLKELRRAARIVSQLRDVYRPARGQARRPVDVNALVHQVMDVTRRQAEQQGVSVDVSLGDVPQIMALGDRIMQVVLNLVLNGLDAMPAGGRLGVSTEGTYDPPGVSITVSDTGEGIDAERLPFIFDLFYTSKVESVGLGLFITQSIVDDHGGHIGVTTSPGEGSSFTVWLPA